MPLSRIGLSQNQQVTGNVTFTGTGNRIRGDFSSGTLANRVAFQTSTTNGTTSIAAIPNGTSPNASFRAFAESDLTNARFIQILSNSGGDVRLTSDRLGTGTYLPLLMYTGGSERLRIDTSGNVGIGTSSPTARLDIRRSTTDGLIAEFHQSSGYGIDIGSSESVASISSGYLQALTFRTDPSSGQTERMRILSGGEVCIKTTSSVNSAPLTIGNGTANDSLVICGLNGVDGNYVDWLVSAPYGSNLAEQNRIRSSISGVPGNSGFQFMISDGFGASTQTQSFRINRTSCTVVGSLSKGSGSFKIDHPLPAKTDTHHLVHSFIEGPQADLIYRGVVNLVAGKASVNIDESSDMTEGTFEALCRKVQCFTTNESDWIAVRGKVSGNILTIEAQDQTATSSISWMVIGERKDKHMYDTDWTDENGKVIVEPLKITEALENQ
jgi:hypothetical protein